jgi:outer membrane protein
MKALIAAAAFVFLAAPGYAQTTPAPAAPAQLPEGAKVAFIDIQQIATESAEGKVASAKVQELERQRITELNEKNKALQANQQKLQQGGGLMAEDARMQLQKEIDRQQLDIQRFTQDAQADLQELQRDVQAEFERKLVPIIQQVSEERGIQLLFDRRESGIIWAHSALDLTAEVIKRFDAVGADAAQKR